MMMDTQIYGLIAQYGDTFHYGCVNESERLTEAWTPLYSDADDGNGMSCDECGEYIFEPSFELVYSSDDVPGLDFSKWGGRDDLAAWTVDAETSEDVELEVDWADSDYGQAMAARTADGTVAVIWATPDHPRTIADIEVES